jgi:hypothetical protein
MSIKRSRDLAGCFSYARRRQVSSAASRMSADADKIAIVETFRNSSSNEMPTSLSLVFHQLATILRSPGGNGSVPFLATPTVSLVPGAALNLKLLSSHTDE